MRKRTLAREFALQLLYQYEMNPQPSEELFCHFWEEHANTPDEIREFAENIVQGTLQNLTKLDEVISRYTENWGLNRMAHIDRNILRFATFELLYRSDIPPKVTINEAVNVAKKFSQEDSGKFVNGILDKIVHTENPTKVSSQSS